MLVYKSDGSGVLLFDLQLLAGCSQEREAFEERIIDLGDPANFLAVVDPASFLKWEALLPQLVPCHRQGVNTYIVNVDDFAFKLLDVRTSLLAGFISNRDAF